jgi:hypothetical protein
MKTNTIGLTVCTTVSILITGSVLLAAKNAESKMELSHNKSDSNTMGASGSDILCDDFSVDSGLWELYSDDYSLLDISIENNRLQCFAPNPNEGDYILASATSNGWTIDMTQDWSLSGLWHVDPPYPYYGEVGGGFEIILNNPDEPITTFSVENGLAVDEDGNSYSYTALSIIVDWVYVETIEFYRDSIEGILYIWFDASSETVCVSDVGLYDPDASCITVTDYLNSSDAFMSIMGYTMGYVPSFSQGSIWADDLCIHDGNIIGDPTCEGDVNGDSVVGVNDLLAAIAVWGESDPDADIDGDGVVGVNDLLAMIANWGPCV